MQKEIVLSVTKKDLDISYFSGSGAGGQHRNRHNNCVRILHRESGVSTVCQEYKSLDKNKKEAFKRLVEHPKFKRWMRVEFSKRITNQDELKKEIEKEVNNMMRGDNLKIDFMYKSGKDWKKKKFLKNKDLKWMIENGILFEINRRILHPLGLSIENITDQEENTGKELNFRIWDLRDDPEGITYDNEFNEERENKVISFDLLFDEKRPARESKLGYHIQFNNECKQILNYD